MTSWEKKIINAFIAHYFASASAASEKEENRKSLRLRTSILFPNFDTANPNEKESYLEAAELLEQKGIVKLTWEKAQKGERLKTLSCENFKKIFDEAGKPYPWAEAEKIRTMLAEKVKTLKKSQAALGKEKSAETSPEVLEQVKKVINLLEYFSQHFGIREIGQGATYQTMEDLVRLFEFICDPVKLEKITARALSVLLYRDSKHLENLLSACTHLLSRAQKTVALPDFSFLERSFPETMISGKIIFEYKKPAHPLINAKGLILNLPLESIERFSVIQLISEKKEKSVLTIENKETFFALGSPQKHDCPNSNLSRYDCYLYTGGYPNQAAAALIKLLAASGFTFYHAGDLDPDGILILQFIQDIAERPVFPVKMDATTFDLYRPWARTLDNSMLRQIKKIQEDVRAIPCVSELLQRIEQTGMGIEQEIIDYR
ncbi:MAG: DUF2220 domain-containing protein [Spirochaetes bacterium]|nr:DUF2220 domain-containing protein [Spirochaetota bacterium]